MEEIRPQQGPQENFLSSPADIVIYGGAAGGGKSWGLLLEPLRHVTTNKEFYATIFRRNTTQIRNQGGLWDESTKLYNLIPGTEPIQTTLEWKFSDGGRVKFAHLEHDKTVLNYQGSQIPLICFDELTHFSEYQFFYMLSRNRSMCGVRPYIRATTNPDADSWVVDFIGWWIDDQGYAIKERSGIVRWFVRVNGDVLWADSLEECIELHGKKHLSADDEKQIRPKSVTFIEAKLEDNKALTDADPNYRANLEALPLVDQERLLRGNWRIRYDSGLIMFSEQKLLADMRGVQYPAHCKLVFAIVDTAIKDGKENDGTAVSYWAYDTVSDMKLVCLDWDYIQIQGASLEVWIPSVIDTLEKLAKECGAREGQYLYIEDKGSGSILLQQCRNKDYGANAIPGGFVAMGKSDRAINVSGKVYNDQVKFSEQAYNKVVNFKGVTKNHMLTQIINFRIGIDNGQDDLFDTFCYAIQIALIPEPNK